MQFLFLTFLFIIGACLGSFICCQARRLHLSATAEASPRSKSREPKTKTLGNRSVCLSCHHQLKWYDNIPIISWLCLRGRCRYCHKKIGAAEIITEFATALVFLGIGCVYIFRLLAPVFGESGAFSSAPMAAGLFGSSSLPLETTLIPWLSLFGTLIFASLLIFLAVYDALYSQLPTLILTFSIICATLILILKYWSFFSSLSPSLFTSDLLARGNPSPLLIIAPLGSVAILGGTYLLLYLISHGRWVGDGDWLLGLALGLALASPWQALLMLFLANTLATLFAMPLILHDSKKSTKNVKTTKSDQSAESTTVAKITKAGATAKATKGPEVTSPLNRQIPLGPFLIAAYFLVVVFSDFIAKIVPNML